MTDHVLPNGHILRIVPATFSEAKALLQEVTKSLNGVDLEIGGSNLYFAKELLCAALSSPSIEEAVMRCVARCQINDGQGFKAYKQGYFEDVGNRENFITLCYEVANANLSPFMKSLFAEAQKLLVPKEKSSQASA